jgi:hypothetical protein
MLDKLRRITAAALLLVVAGTGTLVAQGKTASQDKNSVKVPGGLGFAEFKGYESWQVISVSQGAPGIMAAIVGNREMIQSYLEGIPGNGKVFPDGARMAKIHWNTKKLETFPTAINPGTLHDVDFMVKDSKRFASSGGWGYAAFEYDTLTNQFRPADRNSKPPQANDASCGFGCHTIVKSSDYVFTKYAPR